MMRCDLNQTKLDLNPNKTCYSLVYNGNLQVKRITDQLYKDATIYLDRKLDKIRKHFNE